MIPVTDFLSTLAGARTATRHCAARKKCASWHRQIHDTEPDRPLLTAVEVKDDTAYLQIPHCRRYSPPQKSIQTFGCTSHHHAFPKS